MGMSMSDLIRQHYDELYQEHGRSHHAVQHSSQEGQYRRFELLCENIGQYDSVADLGCGFGDMLSHLRSIGHQGRYTGLDLMPEFIEASQQSFKSDGAAEFVVFDLLKDPIETAYDHVIISGTFNNRLGDVDWKNVSRQILVRFFGKTKKSLRFNMLSRYVDYRDADLHYEDPLEVFDFCKKDLTPYVSLFHDYTLVEGGFPYEFMIFANKDSR